MYETIEQIKAANAARGHHFFEPATMRFFDSRVLDGVYGGRYFVTSERGDWDGAERKYTIRECDADGEVSTVGEFQAFATRVGAIRTAQELGSS